VSSTCRVATFAHIGDDYADSPIQVTGEEFEVSQFVFVKKEAEDHDTPNAIPYWIAKVLEVRAGDAQHVYLRIYWAYRPEDLPGGRQPHHGDCELIVSNHMDVIDALCVQGAANVVHWDDYPDSLTFPAPEQLYWRQSLDITKRKGSQLTKLNTYCLDEKPSNPDERLIQCPSCSGYLHAHCLEECAIDDALKEHNIAKTKVSGPKIQHQRKAFFEAEISTTDELRLTVTDKRKGQKDRHWDVDILCLLCNSIVAEAIAHLPAPTIPVGQSADDESEEGEEEEKKEEEEEEEEEGEEMSVVGDVPTSATVATTVPAAKAPVPEPQSRGLPKGTRKKERHRPPVTRIPVLHQGEKNLPSEECFLDMYHAHDGAKILDTQDLSAQTQNTPLSSALLPANMFQSSVRSVKRLLHWESLH